LLKKKGAKSAQEQKRRCKRQKQGGLGAAGAANLKPNIEARQQAANEFAGKLKETIEDMKARGLSQRAMCEKLNNLGIKTAKGGAWSLVQLQRVMVRL
jgi:hypothetical protein